MSRLAASPRPSEIFFLHGLALRLHPMCYTWHDCCAPEGKIGALDQKAKQCGFPGVHHLTHVRSLFSIPIYGDAYDDPEA